MKKIKILALMMALVLAVASFAGCGKEDESGLTKVTIQLDGAATPYYSPIYVAQEMGYFEEEGIEVEFFYAAAADIVKNVAADNVEFGFPNADAVVLAKSQEIPVKVVHNTYQNGLGSTIFKTDSGIKEAADLKGKKVAVTSLGSPNYIQLQALLQSAGLTVDDIELEIVGTGAIVNALLTDQVDAIVFSMLRTIEMNHAGADVSEIKSDTVLPSFGNVLIASDKYIAENAEVIDGFSRALTKGIEYMIDGNVEEAVKMSVEKHIPTFDETKIDITVKIIEDVFIPHLWKNDFATENGIGSANMEKWEESIASALKYNIIDEKFEATDIVYDKIQK